MKICFTALISIRNITIDAFVEKLISKSTFQFTHLYSDHVFRTTPISPGFPTETTELKDAYRVSPSIYKALVTPHLHLTQQSQNICITFEQCWTNVGVVQMLLIQMYCVCWEESPHLIIIRCLYCSPPPPPPQNHWTKAGLMLGHHLRRWPNNKSTFLHNIVLVGPALHRSAHNENAESFTFGTWIAYLWLGPLHSYRNNTVSSGVLGWLLVVGLVLFAPIRVGSFSNPGSSAQQRCQYSSRISAGTGVGHDSLK